MEPLKVTLGQEPLEAVDCEVSSGNSSVSSSRHKGRGGRQNKNSVSVYPCTTSGNKRNNKGKHRVLTKKYFKCSLCGYTTSNSSNINHHTFVHSGEKPYKCGNCESAFSSSYSLKAHQLSVHKIGKEFKCSLCDYSTVEKGNLKRHMFVHSGEKPHKCGECEAAFRRLYLLKAHKLSVHKIGKGLKCSLCDYSTFQKGHLISHMFVHSGEKLHKCGDCAAAFSRLNSLKAHQLSDHKIGKEFKCSLCDYSTFQKSYLKGHMFVHSGEKPHKCGDCAAAFSRLNSLKAHQLSDHKIGKEFKCSLCDYSTVEKGNLKRHMFVHTGEKPHKCGECEAAFRHLYLLKAHKLSVHKIGKGLKCSLCDYSTFQKGHLKSHMFVHSGEKLHKCGDCAAAFSRLNSLKAHQLSDHKIGKEFKCSLCDYSTFQKSYLKGHMFVHSGEKPHKCGDCEGTFSRLYLLKAHQLSIHKIGKGLKCSLCDYSTFHKGHLKSHMFVHSGEKPHKCGDCEGTFSYLYLLKAHQLSVHKIGKGLKCSLCDYSTFQKRNLKSHMFVHSGEKPHKCGHCEEAFSRLNSLKVHQFSVHKIRKGLKCSLCDYSTVEKGNLKRHMFVHSGEKPHKCGDCEAAYKSTQGLKVHQLSVHNRGKGFECLMCDFVTFYKSHLKAHELVHSGKKPYKCGKCEAAFSQSDSLKVHQLSVHKREKRFQCSLCDYSTFKKSSLKCHLLVHNKEKRHKCGESKVTFKHYTSLKRHLHSVHEVFKQPNSFTSKNTHLSKHQSFKELLNNKEETLYRCKECDYYASTINILKKHISRHSDSEPLECPVCGSLFKSLVGLRFHVLDHTGEAPYQCLLCDSSFKQEVLVIHHLATEHQELG